MYAQSITRAHRTAFVIAIDRSGSMAEPVWYGDRCLSKAEAVAEVTDRLLFELIERARRSDGVRDYYDIAVMGYAGDGAESLLGGPCAFVPVTELAERQVPLRRSAMSFVGPDGSRTVRTVTMPAYIAPAAAGETPMYLALNEVCELLRSWCFDMRHADSFPPVVFNITDGEASDCDEAELQAVCRRIRSLRAVLLIHIHIASQGGVRRLLFPTADEIARCGNRYAQLLFDASSEVPPVLCDAVREVRGDAAQPPFRGMSFNASIVELLAMLNIGSISIPIQ